MWPFKHNWNASYVVTYSFKTEVLTSRSGREQRRALRFESRRTIQTTLLSAPGLQRQADAWLWGQQAEPFDHVDPVSGALSRVRLPAELTLTHRTARVAESTITLDVDPGSDTLAAALPDARFVYQGRYVLPFAPDWGPGIPDTLSFPRQAVDFDSGRIAVTRPIAFGSRSTAIALLSVGAAELAPVVDFFRWARGRQRDFLAPSPADQLDIIETVSSTIIVDGDVTGMVSDGVNSVVKIAVTGGTVFYREVLEAELSGGVTFIRLVQDIPDVVNRDTVRSAHWVRVARFASDDLSIEWKSSTVATPQMQFVSLPPSDPENGPDYDADTAALIDYFGSFAFTDPLQVIVNQLTPKASEWP